ncbi:MAG: hypothetical protein KatS3mg110_2787 [Pirellulaceae bacterium]|nr:MAG: hypothetical protein KatS3mg110_2787 [Pirellulaceae bacterium]
MNYRTTNLGFPGAWFWAAGVILAGGVATAQDLSSELLDQRQLAAAGLVRQWFSRATVPANYPGTFGWTLYVSPYTKKTVVEVRSAGGTYTYADRDLDFQGNPLGLEGAQRKAQLQVERLTLRGQSPTVATYEVPDAYLVIMTPSATLECFDAETGARLWSTQVGPPGHPVYPPAVSEKWVAVVNGTEWVLVDRATGEITWRKKTEGVPGAGPALSRSLLFVPIHDGTMEIYSTRDFGQPMSLLRSLGHPTASPVITLSSVAWPTDAGHLYVALAEQRFMNYRIETGRTIDAQPAYRPVDGSGVFYIPSADGYLYCVDERSGIIWWTYATGQLLIQTPLLYGNSVLLVTGDNNLYHLSGDPPQRQPELQWIAPRVRKVLAVHKQRIYAVGMVGQLVVLDLASGTRLYETVKPLPAVHMINGLTNRIYVATTHGRIECLRPLEAAYPDVHIDLSKWRPEEMKPEAGADMGKAADGSTMPPMGPATDVRPAAPGGDPFAPRP